VAAAATAGEATEATAVGEATEASEATVEPKAAAEQGWELPQFQARLYWSLNWCRRRRHHLLLWWAYQVGVA